MIPTTLWKNCREWPEGVRDQAYHSVRQQTARSHSAHWWLSHQRCDRNPWRQRSLCSLNLQLDKVTHALRWIASGGDSQTTHAIILTYSTSLLQKVK